MSSKQTHSLRTQKRSGSWSGPERHLAKLQTAGLHILPSQEVEGLLCKRGVAEAIARHAAVDDFSTKYAAFEQAVRQRFFGLNLNKQVLERAKCDLDLRLTGIANKAYPEVDAAQTRQRFTDIVTKSASLGDVGGVYDEHEKLVSSALASGAEEFLKVLPGKDCLSLLCDQFGITKPRYIELVSSALNQPDSGGKPELEALRLALVVALAAYLPRRA